MAGLDDLYAQIPTSDIASKLGADEGEVNSAIQTLVPTLLAGLQHNETAARGLLDVDGGAGQAAGDDGHQAVATLFGGNDTDQVAAALASGGAGNRDLIKQLLPVVLPIVLAYIGKQLTSGGGAAQAPAAQKEQGGLADVLGSILGGGGDKSLGGVLGSVLGSKGGGLGDILGGLLGGKR